MVSWRSAGERARAMGWELIIVRTMRLRTEINANGTVINFVSHDGRSMWFSGLWKS